MEFLESPPRARARNDEGRPGERAALSVNNGDLTTVPPATLTHPHAVAPAYVVFTLRDDGQVKRRNVYLSLHSAIKAKERAEARGDVFEMALMELVPVPGKPAVVVGGAA